MNQPATSDALTVFLIDDDPSVRDSLALLLGLKGYRTQLFARAEDFLARLDQREALTGCVVSDVRMPGLSGLELQEAAHQRGCALPFIIITAHGDAASARAAFRNRAVDFLEKPFDDAALIAAIEEGFARERARHANAAGATRLAALTPREREIALLLARGLGNREISDALGISHRTVEVHKARVMEKLGVDSLAGLMRVMSAAP
jgi:FixJ family two-component response regulator